MTPARCGEWGYGWITGAIDRPTRGYLLVVGWTATGPLESQKSHSRYNFGESWTMDMSRTSMRPAMADITITGLPGGEFDGTSQEATLQTVKAASLLHE